MSAFRYRVTLFDGGKEVQQWTTPNYVYQSGSKLTFKDENGHEIAVHGTYVVEEL